MSRRHHLELAQWVWSRPSHRDTLAEAYYAGPLGGLPDLAAAKRVVRYAADLGLLSVDEGRRGEFRLRVSETQNAIGMALR